MKGMEMLMKSMGLDKDAIMKTAEDYLAEFRKFNDRLERIEAQLSRLEHQENATIVASHVMLAGGDDDGKNRSDGIGKSGGAGNA